MEVFEKINYLIEESNMTKKEFVDRVLELEPRLKEQDFFEFDVEFATNNNIKQSKEVREILNLLQYLPARAINDLKNKLYEYRKLYEKGF